MRPKLTMKLRLQTWGQFPLLMVRMELTPPLSTLFIRGRTVIKLKVRPLFMGMKIIPAGPFPILSNLIPWRLMVSVLLRCRRKINLKKWARWTALKPVKRVFAKWPVLVIFLRQSIPATSILPSTVVWPPPTFLLELPLIWVILSPIPFWLTVKFPTPKGQ